MKKNNRALLHIEQLPGQQMNLKLEGPPAMVCIMIATAMKVNQEIAASMIAPVVKFAKEQGIDCGDLGRMVIIPGLEL